MSKFTLSSGFSMIELVILLGIFSIITIGLIKHFSLNTTQGCIKELSSALLSTQNAIGDVYLRAMLTKQEVNIQAVHNLFFALQELKKDSKNCKFIYTYPKLQARIYAQTLTLQVSSLNINPKVSCNFNDKLCRDFMLRILVK